MKKIKEFEKLINRLVKSTPNQKHVNLLKSLPIPDSIIALNIYLKRIRSQTEKTTLTIESAIPLAPGEISTLTTALKARHYITRVETKVNPLIYGGLRVKIGDRVYDSSVAERILQITDEIRG